MRKPLPPLNWFRAFEASARTLSFTAAADEIGMTQSAVSQQIRALESRFQVALFARHARGISLTDEGRKLLPQVETALETLTTATERFDTTPRSTDLTVFASISIIEWVISPALSGFQNLFPDVSVRFLSAIWPDEFNMMQADVEVRFGSDKQVGTGAQALLPNNLVALKSPDLSGTLTDLPLIESVGTSRGWQAWGDAAGISGLKPTLFADSYGLALQLAAQGNGVALASSVLANHAVKNGVLELAHPAYIVGKEGYFLSVNKTNPTSVAFGDWLRDLTEPQDA